VPPTLQFLPGALQHVALTVADEAEALALRERLQARGVPTMPVFTPGGNAPRAHLPLPRPERPPDQGILDPGGSAARLTERAGPA